MHSQMSGASAPILAPPPSAPASAPALVPPRPKRSGAKRLGWIVFLILAAVGIERGVHFARQTSTATESAAQVIRTAAVTQGAIQRTVRLTGTTGAERFSSLISPQLRGNRSGGGRDGSLRSGGGGGGGGGALQSRGTAAELAAVAAGCPPATRLRLQLQQRLRLLQPMARMSAVDPRLSGIPPPESIALRLRRLVPAQRIRHLLPLPLRVLLRPPPAVLRPIISAPHLDL
jgi:hypothetical protein